MSTQRLSYEVVDVFTSDAYAGNQLAVVYGADDLSTTQMQAIAAEFNLSETAFPVALTEADRAAGADYRVRIFTPMTEIPFAGHPTVGTAWALARRGVLAPGQRVQACGAGLIGLTVPDDAAAAVELVATPRDYARELPPDASAEVAELVGLTGDDLVGPAVFAGTGLTWVHLPIKPAAVAAARPGSRPLNALTLGDLQLVDPCDGVNAYALTGRADPVQGPIEVSSRVFVPGFGIPEDPATGSAAAGLGVVLVAAGVAASDGQTTYRIQQGVDMGRPSILDCRVEATNGVATRCHVAGQVAPGASGTLPLPPKRQEFGG